MTESTSDFLFVGGGQNNLTAAAYLAASGHRVTVLERHAYLGGGCITREITQPGFRHDLHATNIFMAQANPLLARDELGLLARFGLKFARTEHAASHGTIFEDGSAIALYRDVERSVASIARYSPPDAEAYRRLVTGMHRFLPLLSMALFSPPVTGGRLANLLSESAAGREFLGLVYATSASIIDQHFSDDRVKVHLLRLASEMMMSADSPGSGFGLMFMLALYHRYPVGFVVGGAQGLAAALERCIRHHGGEVVTCVEVARIENQSGRATAVCTLDDRRYAARHAIIAGLPPWQLARYLTDAESLTEKSRAAPNSDFTCFLAHLALPRAPQPAVDAEFQNMAFTVLAPRDPAAIVSMTRAIREGHLPNTFTASYVCATLFDPSRAPPGQHTLYLYQPVPTRLAGHDMNSWDSIRSRVGDELIARTLRQMSNISPNSVLGAVYQSPLDHERESASFRNGDVAGVAMTPDQFLTGRPIPELANYRVPGIQGLYLCGPFMHPGGGANGGGRPLAMRVLMDLGLSLQAFSY